MRFVTNSIIFACLFTGGCVSNYTEMQTGETNQAFILNSHPSFLGYFYLGSDTTHHFFLSKWKSLPDRRFKILKEDLQIAREVKFGKPHIRIFLWKPDGIECEVFAQIDKATLYIEK